ncbi:hypothetical protein BASA50_006070 [Batrachochytrium salamandrivorans]|uniref:t-SNARE coiled-coil homology domain-containing protein n=1 Tax=Batrachochytrium salamandrivorans TaxID=1357716 RepID=A0ABQ8FAS1_9FUNG|nr:hypothetical protein BASA50_006070 [Batrachochytrium salamandrivorans]
MRDAMKRLEHIYTECAPEAIEEKAADANLDEFSKLRKKLHTDVKIVRQALKDRHDVMRSGGTTTESAEASYRIRVMIKTLKEYISRMQEIVDKESRKKKPKDPEKVAKHKEILDLCKQHVEECESLEKRRQADGFAADRVELFSSNGGGNGGGNGDGDGIYGGGHGGGNEQHDPFTNSELPDIDVEEDIKAIRHRDKDIDKDVENIGLGVARLKEIALDMGQELENQNTDLERIDRNVEHALDHVDNINITMKKTLDGVMKGDKFMVNCILLCVILALVAFISTQFMH